MTSPFSSQKGMLAQKIVPIMGLSLTAFVSVEWMKDWSVSIEVYWKQRDIQDRVVSVATRKRLEAAGVESL
jgi:hypothetical protein